MSHWRFLGLCILIGWLTACSRLSATPGPTATVAPTSPPLPTPTATAISPVPLWLRDSVLYEIFPRSFFDYSGDGVGDLRGIEAKLDYIQALGANTLWLMSVFSSTDSIGFEVVDLSTVSPALGTQEDLKGLIAQAHNRKMRVIIDLNVVYTSRESPPFKDAYGKPDSPYSDWYQWTNTAHTAAKFYTNLRTKPLLNHASPAVQAHLFQVARDWLGMGVDGFRLNDVTSVPHEFWKPFHKAIKEANPDAVLIGEVGERDPQKLAPYFQDEFDALFDVPMYYALAGSPERSGVGLINGRGSLNDVEAALRATDLFSPTAQLVCYIGTHNTNRIASLVGQNLAREKVAAVLLLTLPGTPLIYYGDEIGMPGYLGMGPSGDEYRRAPMDWFKSGKGTGMTTWFKDAARVNKPNDGISVEEQRDVKNSLWSLYQLLVTERMKHAALRLDNYQTIASPCRSCYAYLRWDANDLYLIALNLSDQTQSLTLDLSKTPWKVTRPGQDLFQGGSINLPSDGRYTLTLDAWGARVVRWGK